MRVVLDTNVVISALLFSRARMSWIRQAWQAGRLRPVVSRPTVAELLRVLAYPKFQLSAADQEDILADFLPFAETAGDPDDDPTLPRCPATPTPTTRNSSPSPPAQKSTPWYLE